MNMLQAIRRYYAGYAQFSGRASRADFWLAALYVWLLQAVVHFVSTVLDVFLLGSPDLSLRDAAVLLVGITHALPSLALLARRLHDAGFSRAWLFLGLVPFVGPLTLLVFALQPSTPRPDTPPLRRTRFRRGHGRAALTPAAVSGPISDRGRRARHGRTRRQRPPRASRTPAGR